MAAATREMRAEELALLQRLCAVSVKKYVGASYLVGTRKNTGYTLLACSTMYSRGSNRFIYY